MYLFAIYIQCYLNFLSFVVGLTLGCSQICRVHWADAVDFFQPAFIVHIVQSVLSLFFQIIMLDIFSFRCRKKAVNLCAVTVVLLS